MGNLLVVTKREFKSYFHSPVAYAVICIFLLISGFFFYSAMSLYGLVSFELSRTAQVSGPQELDMTDMVMGQLFGNLSIVMLLMMPLITMRLFSEERKNGSAELLFTWPIRDFDLVMGKYLAALSVFFIMLASTASYLGFVCWHSTPHWQAVFAGYLGLVLLGASFLALGAFVSTLTENQIISAALSFGALLVFWVVGWAVEEKTDTLSQTLNYLSILKHFYQFARGVIDTRDVVYYLTFTFTFLFFTFRSLESGKWRG